MDSKIINDIKALGIDMIEEAGSGHPGIVLGAAPIIYTLYCNHLNVNVKDPSWINRDRFVLSAGHGSALLYATLFMAGYDLSIDDLKGFRKLNSKTPGHPELSVPGVDVATGPLGQGIATAVGLAIASKHYSKVFEFPKEIPFKRNKSLIDYNVYVLCSDGDLMEGISYEAASLAGTLKLDNLIVLYDSNNISLDGETKNSFTEDVKERFKSLGWNVDYVKNGNDLVSLNKAINKAKKTNAPSFIEVKTKIGEGSYLEGTNKAHGKALLPVDIEQLKKKLGVKLEPFSYNDGAKKQFNKSITERCTSIYNDYVENYERYTSLVLNKDESKINYLTNLVKYDLLNYDFKIENGNDATRDTNAKIMNELTKFIPNFIGGSADLASSTKTYLDYGKDFSHIDYTGKNIWYGVREQAMGAISNGLALVNMRPFASTFLVFSDYMKSSIRLSALMNLPVTYIFSHDSINVGEDGPTHQPVEQLVSLRAIPNLKVFRPYDANELIGSWNYILNSKHPNSLILSRTETDIIVNTDKNKVKYGAYVVKQELGRLHGILIATGYEVSLACKVADALKEKGLNLRVVSMPSMELYNEQNSLYKEEVLPKLVKKIVIEAGSSFGWHQFVYSEKYLITIDRFGKSGSADDVLKEYGFDLETVKDRVEKLII